MPSYVAHLPYGWDLVKGKPTPLNDYKKWGNSEYWYYNKKTDRDKQVKFAGQDSDTVNDLPNPKLFGEQLGRDFRRSDRMQSALRAKNKSRGLA